MRQASSARGNVARLYLGMDRAIPYTAPYPASIGYHPGRNALIAIATDSTGQMGGQFIHWLPVRSPSLNRRTGRPGPQAASSTTVSGPTGRSVTKLWLDSKCQQTLPVAIPVAVSSRFPIVAVAVRVPIIVTARAVSVLFRLLAAHLIVPATLIRVTIIAVVAVQEPLSLSHQVVVIGSRRRSDQ